MELTLDQIELASDNSKLINGFIHQKIRHSRLLYDMYGHVNFEHDDWTGLVSISFMKAIRTYDSSKGALSTYFYTIAYNDFINYMYKYKSDIMSQTSFYETEDEIYWSGTQDCSVRQSALDIDMDYYINRLGLDETNLLIVNRLSEGYRQLDIAEELCISRQAVHKRVNNIRSRMENLL